MIHRVVVTGAGVMSSVGNTFDTFWENCLAGVSPVTRIPDRWRKFHSFQSDVLTELGDYLPSLRAISKLDTLQCDPNQLLAISAVAEALQRAGLTFKEDPNNRNVFYIPELKSHRTGIYAGTGAGGITSLMSAHTIHLTKQIPFWSQELEIQKEYLKSVHGVISRNIPSPARFNPFTVNMMMPNGCAGKLGIKFSITGANRTFCYACASGTVAIGSAFHALRDGVLDCVIAGGSEYLADKTGGIFRSFDTLGVLAKGSPETANCPFDVRHSGFLFSEGGACFLVLETLEHALGRKAHILAEITGYGESFDTTSMISMDPDGAAISRAIENALSDASISSKDITYINAHGTGTITNDTAESAVLENMFGKRPVINSTKSILGHTIGASGAFEAAVSVQSIYTEKIHPGLNISEPIRDLCFTKSAVDTRINYSLSNSFAFGGYNAALVFKRFS